MSMTVGNAGDQRRREGFRLLGGCERNGMGSGGGFWYGCDDDSVSQSSGRVPSWMQ
ncbi:hypothetical protein F2Q70_00041444 [Brassica cretica]|uniref:Uncharacterized protein n=1 Tax=Brassica cretica TaxID=69181 RepID=A0A8S9K9E0_BRACR|nr:hypothetical protein F2Q70_00041444 [Brassica cretica]